MTRAASTAPSWSDRVDQFLEHLRQEERSEHTRRNYRDDVLAFSDWYRDENRQEEPELSRISKSDILGWKEHIEKHGRADRQGTYHPAALATVNRKLSAMRAFLGWARELGYIDPRVDAPKPRKRHGRPRPKSLEPEERKALIRAVEARHDTRDVLLIRIGLEAGLRVSEMASLRWSDVKISERKGELRVRHGKGNKERTVDLTKTLRNAFLEYGYQRHHGKDKAVLEGQRGPLSVRGIQDIVERLAAITRVGKRIGLEGCTVHTLRHTCADWLLNEVNLSVPEVAEILGHSDLKTTMVYLAPHKGRLADRMAAIEG
jgi:integrase/recombinase XerC